MTNKYPWYTPYQFAGNKPIWAIDVDGLEEFIFQYKVENGKTTQINKIDNKRLIPDLDRLGSYIVKDKRTGTLFNEKELGQVQYQYFDPNGNRLNKRRDYEGNLVDGENELMPEHAENFFGSVYIGPNNPTYIDANGKKKPDYRREPQDEEDAGALGHDKGYDAKNAAGAGDALFSERVKPEDQKLVNDSNTVLEKSLTRGTDNVTGKPVTLKTGFRAYMVKFFFEGIINSPSLKGNPNEGTHVVK